MTCQGAVVVGTSDAVRFSFGIASGSFCTSRGLRCSMLMTKSGQYTQNAPKVNRATTGSKGSGAGWEERGRCWMLIFRVLEHAELFGQLQVGSPPSRPISSDGGTGRMSNAPARSWAFASTVLECNYGGIASLVHCTPVLINFENAGVYGLAAYPAGMNRNQ